MKRKDTNPKDAVGIRKPPMSTVPANVLQEIGVGMMEGARKYGRHNYRAAGIRASVYYDATLRHLMAWWEGEDIDPDSGMSHIAKALCSLVVLRDAQQNRMINDDRPPPLSGSSEERREDLQQIVDHIFEAHPTSVPPYTRDHTDELEVLGDRSSQVEAISPSQQSPPG